MLQINPENTMEYHGQIGLQMKKYWVLEKVKMNSTTLLHEIRRWEQDIQDWLETTTTQEGRMAEDRVVFRKKI